MSDKATPSLVTEPNEPLERPEMVTVVEDKFSDGRFLPGLI